MKKLLALLLAVTMLCTLCACGKKEEKPSDDTKPTYGIPPAEDIAAVAEAFITAYCTQDWITYFSMHCYDALQQWKDDELKNSGKTEAEYCAEAQAQAETNGFNLGYTIDSFDTYLKAKHEVDKQYKQEAYGKYTITATAIDSVKMSEEKVAEQRTVVLGAGGDYATEEAVNTITEIHVVTVSFAIDGEKKDLEESYMVYIGNYQGQWRVTGHTT